MGSLYGYILRRCVIGVCLLVAFVWFFISAITVDQKLEFSRLVNNSEARLQERLVINEAALSGFASVLQITGANNLAQVRNYTEQMRASYNQIYMFEALQGITPEDQHNFAKTMQGAGYPDYAVYRYVSRESKTGQPSKPFNRIADTAVMFPVFFIDPQIELAQGLMGFDMMSAKIPREPLIEALLTGQTQATKPYKLQEGGTGYVLYKPLQQVQEPSGADAIDSLVAAIVVLIDPMMALVHEVIPNATISLNYGGQADATNTLYPNANKLPVWTMDTLIRDVAFDRYGQPFTLTIVQPLGIYTAQIYLLIALLVLLLISFILYLHSSIGRRKNQLQRDFAVQQLAREHSLLAQKVAERTAALKHSSDENQRLANQIIRSQEDHSKHLARELHDDFGQLLSAIKINTHMLSQKQADEKTQQYVQEIAQYSDDLYDKMHDLIQFLRPVALDAFGLKVAIAESLSQCKLAERNIALELQVDDAVDDMEEAYSIATYRIVQELANNTVKHAQATQLQVWVQVKKPEHVLIQVTDNGIGITSETGKKHFGIHGLKERVHILGGTLALANLADGGLQIKVTLPYKQVGK